jgi:uracil-DNA glycosylase family 4
MSGSHSRWTGFLPSRALVMGRLRSSQPVAVPAQTPAPAPAEALPVLSQDNAVLLAQVAADLQGCTRCKLCDKRKTIVVGEGNPRAELVFVGEGPGEQEDIQGRPFVGRAGELLDKMIEAMGLKREQVYIANVVKCRPPGNRNPEPDEIASCSPFLERQLDIIRPKVVVALGKFAAQTLLQTDMPISKMRGHFKTYRGAKLMPTFHPAYLLRNPDSKREAWSDLQTVARELGIALPSKPPKKA